MVSSQTQRCARESDYGFTVIRGSERFTIFDSFRPESVACTPSSNASQCLTLPQIEAFHNLYSDYYVADDVYVFAGYSLGGEIGYASGLGNAGPVVSPLPVTYWQNFVFKSVCSPSAFHGAQADFYSLPATLHGTTPLTTTRISCWARKSTTEARKQRPT